MTNETIKPATEVIDEFLVTQSQDAALDSDTMSAIKNLRDVGQLTNTNLLRQLEGLRTAAMNTASEEGPADD